MTTASSSSSSSSFTSSPSPLSLSKLPDQELIRNFRKLVSCERERLALELEMIAELDRRKLFFHYSSLRSYLVYEFGVEEWLAERKIRIARLMTRIPKLKSELESGKLNLSLIELAQGCAYREKLNDAELEVLLTAVSSQSLRQAKKTIATLYPASLEEEELPKEQIRPLNQKHSEVRFIATESLLERLEEIRGLLAHSHPRLKLGELIEILASEYYHRHHPIEKAKRAERRKQGVEQQDGLEQEQELGQGREDEKEQQDHNQDLKPKLGLKHALKPKQSWEQQCEKQPKLQDQPQERKPSKTLDSPTAPWVTPLATKRIAPPSVLYELIRQKGYVCSYTDPVTHQKCDSKHGLEIHHLKAWSKSGETRLGNLAFLCKNHHLRVSFLEFGENGRYHRRG